MEFIDADGTVLFSTGIALPSYKSKFIRRFKKFLESKDMSKVKYVKIVTYWAFCYFEDDELDNYLESKLPSEAEKQISLTYPDPSGWNMPDEEAKIFFPDKFT